MRRTLVRCGLLAVLAAFTAAPAAAGTIVGQFYFQRDVCDFDVDPFCEPAFQFEYFVLDNSAIDSLAGLTFSATIQLDGSDYEDQFIFPTPGPIASGESTTTFGLSPTTPFGAGGVASLIFSIENAVFYPGTLSLSNLLFDDLNLDDGYTPSFSAAVVYTEDDPVAVTEAPSWFVVAIGLGALAIGRALFV